MRTRTFRQQFMQTLSAAVARHGGGLAGVAAVVKRGWLMLRAVGAKRLLLRLRAAARTLKPIAHPAQLALSEPSPAGDIMLRVGVMAHIFYPDLIEEFRGYLSNIPLPYMLLVSVTDSEAGLLAKSRFSDLPNLIDMKVEIVPNRGRDIAPLLVTFRDEIRKLDAICHVHTKKSLYSGRDQEEWRRYLLDSLLGSASRIEWILGSLQANPELGIIYPDSAPSVPLVAHTWLSNLDHARELGARLGIEVDPQAYLDFPAGSMFWIRRQSLEPIFALDLDLSDFPAEKGQKDGTLQHALERIIALVVRQQEFAVGILPLSGDLHLVVEGERNWRKEFLLPIADRVITQAIDADVVSFDIFDTVVLRPFLRTHGARNYLSHLIERDYGIGGFHELREQAEVRARLAKSSDPDLVSIYSAMAELAPPGTDTSALLALELRLEQRHLAPRTAVLNAALQLRSSRRVIGVSDMYLSGPQLTDVLPATVTSALEHVYTSSQTGWRKDTGEAWGKLSELENVHPSRWLHVGDNEHSDWQMPSTHGLITPVHVLRPHSLLDVVPHLRPLRPVAKQADRWQEQLWLGLLANRLAGIGDKTPAAFDEAFEISSPCDFGFLMLGPLLLEFSGWLARLALGMGHARLLFASREGHLLLRAMQALQQHAPAASKLEGQYLLVSRRALGTAMIRSPSDLGELFAGTFNGRLGHLIEARLGSGAHSAVISSLGDAALDRIVFLPEMREEVVRILQPAFPALREVAAQERDGYLGYLASIGGVDSGLLVDIGYAGTIQSRLERVSGAKLDGAYLALRSGIAHTGLQGRTYACFHDSRDAKPGASCPILDNDLLLELLLCPAQGQLSHFARDAEGDLHAIHLPFEDDVQQSTLLSDIQAGALQFIHEAGAAVESDILDLSLDIDGVQRPLQCLHRGLWRAGSWAAALRIDDYHTGRGQVQVVT